MKHCSKAILLYLTIFIHLFSQNEIVVYRVSDDVKIADDSFVKFEEYILSNVIKLYNLKEEKHLTYSYVSTTFDSIFYYLKQKNNITHLAMSSISITENRKKEYDFSDPYMPVFRIIRKIKSDIDHSKWNDGYSKIGFVTNTTHHEYIKHLELKHRLNMVPFNTHKEFNTAIKNETIDFGVTDLKFNEIGDEKIVMIDTLNADVLGIMFPKNDKLTKAFSFYLNYFIRSKKFLSYLRKRKPHSAILTYFQTLRSHKGLNL